MTAHRAAWVECDVCGDQDNADLGTPTVAQARREAKDHGWHQAGGVDICADCWANGARAPRRGGTLAR